MAITPYRYQELVYGDRRLSKLCKLILLRLSIWSVATKDPGGWIEKRHTDIAEDVAASRQAVSRALTQLVSRGYIEHQQPVSNGRYETGKYRLPEAWPNHSDRVTSGDSRATSGNTDRATSDPATSNLRLQRVRSTQESESSAPPQGGRASSEREEPAPDPSSAPPDAAAPESATPDATAAIQPTAPIPEPEPVRHSDYAQFIRSLVRNSGPDERDDRYLAAAPASSNPASTPTGAQARETRHELDEQLARARGSKWRPARPAGYTLAPVIPPWNRPPAADLLAELQAAMADVERERDDQYLAEQAALAPAKQHA